MASAKPDADASANADAAATVGRLRLPDCASLHVDVLELSGLLWPNVSECVWRLVLNLPTLPPIRVMFAPPRGRHN